MANLAFSQPSPPARKLADMEPALAKIAAWDYGQAPDPLIEFSSFLRGAMASRSELPQIEARLIRMLGPETSLAGRDFLCRQLSVAGTGASVPALTAMLGDAATAEMARYALERIPGAGAAGALRGALAKSSGKARVGIMDSLGRRRDARSVPALRELAAAPDAGVADAALTALASVGNGQALAAIGAARSRLSGARREHASQAYLRCADLVAAGGGEAAARRVYRQLSAGNEPPTIRIGALTGLAAVDGRAAAPVLAGELASVNFDVQSAAIRLLSRIPGPDVTALLTRQYLTLGPVGQIRLLAALGERGDTNARAVAMGGVKSSTAEVRTAALAALGKIGDASAVPLLAEAAANSQGDEQGAARESLGWLRGAGVDAAIAAAIDASGGRPRLELIRAAGERASPAAADALMRVAQGADREAARESIRALRNVAGPEQALSLLEVITKTPDAAERRETALTLASVIRRARDPEIAPVLAAFRASADRQVKLALIDIMGQVSAGDALPVLRASLEDADQEMARAAILALTAWQTPDPLPDLLAVARGGLNATRQILALRGFIRVISVPSDRSADETAALLSEAMQLARQPAEKRAILALLPMYPTAAALRMAEAAVKDATVKEEAQIAAESIRALGIR
jgi:HEAT repeat protein